MTFIKELYLKGEIAPCEQCNHLIPEFLCRLQSIAAHRDHFVRRLSVR